MHCTPQLPKQKGARYEFTLTTTLQFCLSGDARFVNGLRPLGCYVDQRTHPLESDPFHDRKLHVATVPLNIFRHTFCSIRSSLLHNFDVVRILMETAKHGNAANSESEDEGEHAILMEYCFREPNE